MPEKRIDSIRVIVKDNTVGIKMSCGGEMYGTYAKFDHSKLSVTEIVESINLLLDHLLKGVKHNG